MFEFGTRLDRFVLKLNLEREVVRHPTLTVSATARNRMAPVRAPSTTPFNTSAIASRPAVNSNSYRGRLILRGYPPYQIDRQDRITPSPWSTKRLILSHRVHTWTGEFAPLGPSSERLNTACLNRVTGLHRECRALSAIEARLPVTLRHPRRIDRALLRPLAAGYCGALISRRQVIRTRRWLSQ